MSLWSSLWTWANLPFVVALAVAVLFGLMQMTGLLGLLAGDGDSDAESDADADGDISAGHAIDGDAHADVHGDVHAESDEASDSSDADAKAPLSIVWQSFAIVFALTGLVANTIFIGQAGSLPTLTLAWTLPVSLFTGFTASRFLSRALGKLLGSKKHEATSRRDLVGQTGIVISSRINADFGEVRMGDKSGHTVRVVCRTSGNDIPEGHEVVVIDCDDSGHLYVAPLEP